MKGAWMAAVTGLVIGATPAEAQAPDGSANRAAMDRFGFMVGRWSGESSMQRGPGERVTTQMTETVERRLGGVVLLIEGRGVLPAAGGAEARVTHQALAVLAYDAQADAYTMRSWIASGQWGDFPVTIIEGGLSWSREVPGGRMRYTAHIGNGEWHEVGEFSRDGTTWIPVLDMRLRREP